MGRLKIKYMFFIVVLFCGWCTQAQTYEGTLGKHHVFLELQIYEGDTIANASYFYGSELKNITLEGTYKNTELVLFDTFRTVGDERELFVLLIQNDSISGTWKKNNVELEVKLEKITTNIEAYRFSKLAFVRDSVSKYDKKELVWFTEKYSKQVLFRLGNGFKKSAREFVNQKLDSIHKNYVMTHLECIGSERKLTIEFISNQYISYSEFTTINCGGAHPSNYTSGYNFDLKNNIQFYKLTDMYPNLNIYQVLKRKYDKEQQIECEYFSYKELWDSYSWVMTKEGIVITPSFPHAMKTCESGFLLTYEELKNGM